MGHYFLDIQYVCVWIVWVVLSNMFQIIKVTTTSINTKIQGFTPALSPQAKVFLFVKAGVWIWNMDP